MNVGCGMCHMVDRMADKTYKMLDTRGGVEYVSWKALDSIAQEVQHGRENYDKLTRDTTEYN